jgi:hypothetical protein
MVFAVISAICEDSSSGIISKAYSGEACPFSLGTSAQEASVMAMKNTPESRISRGLHDSFISYPIKLSPAPLPMFLPLLAIR